MPLRGAIAVGLCVMLLYAASFAVVCDLDCGLNPERMHHGRSHSGDAEAHAVAQECHNSTGAPPLAAHPQLEPAPGPDCSPILLVAANPRAPELMAAPASQPATADLTAEAVPVFRTVAPEPSPPIVLEPLTGAFPIRI